VDKTRNFALEYGVEAMPTTIIFGNGHEVRRFWRTGAIKMPGRLGGEFLILYAIVRIIGEQFRETDASLVLGLSRGIFYSLFMIFIGVAMIVWSRHRKTP
jgi:prolipoprotein diacylglyceryltransferase